MVKDIVGLSANGSSVVQFVVTRCWNAEFQAGSHGDGQVPWVMKVLCAAASTAEGLSWLGDLGPIRGVAEGGVSAHPATKLMTVCYKKGARGGIQSDRSHSGSSQQLSTCFLMKVYFHTVNDLWQGFKMYCFDYAYTLWTL